jgi:hypothetical protein
MVAELRSLAASFEGLTQEQKNPTPATVRKLLRNLQGPSKKLGSAARKARRSPELGLSIEDMLSTHRIRHTPAELGFLELIEVIEDIEVVLDKVQLPSAAFHRAARKPEAVFYGSEVPAVFERLFGKRYSVRLGESRLAAGGRFAAAVAKLFCLQEPKRATLHQAFVRDKCVKK